MWNKKWLKKGVYVDDLSTVDENADIAVGCFIKNSVIGAATVLPYCIITESKIENGANVGPFTYLRPGCHVCEGAKVGGFVEVKKSKIGPKSKVPHLSYIGDAEIGKGCNIGCGVIFCNYDGKNKYKTIVGDDCFIGANVNLVAPIEIENGAYVAAGSTITKNVLAGQLSIARVRQENKELPDKLKK